MFYGRERQIWGLGVQMDMPTFLEGFNFGAGATSGVDGFLVLLGRSVGGLLADHHRFPVLRDRSDSCHISRCLPLPLFLLVLALLLPRAVAYRACNEGLERGYIYIYVYLKESLGHTVLVSQDPSTACVPRVRWRVDLFGSTIWIEKFGLGLIWVWSLFIFFLGNLSLISLARFSEFGCMQDFRLL